VLDYILHLIGMCPDGIAHPNLITFFAYHLQEIKQLKEKIWNLHITSNFRQKKQKEDIQ